MPQPDYNQFIQQARQSGYSDDEIRQEMGKAGWQAGDIARVLPPTATERAGVDTSGDTFSGESGLGSVFDLLKLGASNLQNHPASQWGGDLMNTIRQAYQGQAQETQQMQGLAGQALSAGNPGRAALDFAGGAPVVGHPFYHGVENLSQHNIPGLLGDIVALGGGDIAKEALGGIGRQLGGGAESLFRSAIPFDKAMTLRDIRNATQTALSEKLPAGERSIGRIGDVSAPTDTLLGGIEQQLQPYVTGQNGLRPVSMPTVLQPVADEIKKSMLDRTPEGKAYTKALSDEADEWAKEYPQDMTVADAHKTKRAMYDRIASSQYADNATGIPAAQRVAKEELARGLKDAVNEQYPQVAGLNEKMKSGIDLQQALTNQAKQAPRETKNALLWVMGLSAGETAAAMGHSYVGMAGLAAIAAKQALDSPAIATRLALAMGGSGKVAEALSHIPSAAARGAAIAPQLARPGSPQQSDNPIQSMFNSAKQGLAQDPAIEALQRLGIQRPQ